MIELNIEENLVNEIVKLVNEYDLTFIEATIHHCEKNDLDIEIIGTIISKSSLLKSEIQIEAENINIIKKENRLPL